MDLYGNLIASVLAGYLTGAFLPGYFFGKVFKKIDIRRYGLKNAGATNTFREVGAAPGILAGFFDAAKGILAMAIVYYFLKPPVFVVYLAGLSAVFGHIFPFYFKFKGGRGVATAAGLLAFFLFLAHQEKWLSFTDIALPAFAGLIFFLATFRKAEKKSAIPFLAFLSLLFSLSLLKLPQNITVVFLETTVVFLLAVNLIILRDDKKFSSIISEAKKNKNLNSWRTFFRPLAVVLPILFLVSKEAALAFCGMLFAVFFFLDIFRIVFRGGGKLIGIIFAKEGRYGGFSSLTYFFLAILSSFLFFDRPIAAASVIFLIFGDFFAKFFHALYGRTPLFKKTLEGATACFAGSLAVGYIIAHFTDLSFAVLFLGAAAAAVGESLPLKINDNLTVPLISGGIMQVLKYL